MPYADPEQRRQYHANYVKTHYQEYKDKLIAKGPEAVEQFHKLTRGYAVKHKQKLRDQVFEHYGNKCACCGETQAKFLTLDHVNNDGYLDRGKHTRGGHGLYRQVIRAGFPETFQILCWNCNLGKHYNGGVCPHKETP